MHDTELLILGLCVAIPALSVIARLLDIPYPIVLVLGAIPLGYLPGVPEVKLDPDLVLVIFLPPLLYVAAFFADLRALRADARGLVGEERRYVEQRRQEDHQDEIGIELALRDARQIAERDRGRTSTIGYGMSSSRAITLNAGIATHRPRIRNSVSCTVSP